MEIKVSQKRKILELSSKKKTGIILGIVAIVLMLILMTGYVVFKVYISNYYAADRAEITNIENELRDSCVAYEVEKGTVFLPMKRTPRAIIAFYPGGKVEADAYRGLMYKLSARGFICLLPDMPDNIALLGVDAVDSFKAMSEETQEIADNLDWYMAGHSLGGIAASSYLAERLKEEEKRPDGNPVNKYKGLILCASFPSKDLSDADIRLLSIYGSNDGVLGMDKYNESRPHWPMDYREEVLEGGIHSYFGCYGIQTGDGNPQITNDQQLEMTADIIDEWIDNN